MRVMRVSPSCCRSCKPLLSNLKWVCRIAYPLHASAFAPAELARKDEGGGRPAACAKQHGVKRGAMEWQT